MQPTNIKWYMCPTPYFLSCAQSTCDQVGTVPSSHPRLPLSLPSVLQGQAWPCDQRHHRASVVVRLCCSMTPASPSSPTNHSSLVSNLSSLVLVFIIWIVVAACPFPIPGECPARCHFVAAPRAKPSSREPFVDEPPHSATRVVPCPTPVRAV